MSFNVLVCLFFIFLSISKTAHSQVCSARGTKIFFVNGVLNFDEYSRQKLPWCRV